MNRTGSKTRMADWPREQTCLVRRTVPRFHRSTFFGGRWGGLCHVGPRSLTGIAPWPPVSGARSLNHWITKEVLPGINFSSKLCLHSDCRFPVRVSCFSVGAAAPHCHSGTFSWESTLHSWGWSTVPKEHTNAPRPPGALWPRGRKGSIHLTS